MTDTTLTSNMRHRYIMLLACTGGLLLGSCSSGKLTVKSVGYQSIRTTFARPDKIPDNAKIAVTYIIDSDGMLTPVVKNLTSEILTIDQTKSFFIDTNGTSVSYFDPAVKVTSVTDYTSDTQGMSVNLGSLAAAAGIGGPIGTMLGGMSVGGSTTTGQSTTKATYLADLPTVSIGPKGSGVMSKIFQITGVGSKNIDAPGLDYVSLNNSNSPYRFSVCISYSFDGGETYEKLITDFYVSAMITSPVTKGRINDGFRTIYTKKPDALAEPTHIFYISDNLVASNGSTSWLLGIDKADNDTRSLKGVYNAYRNGILIDYK